jgi:hypothetical protein
MRVGAGVERSQNGLVNLQATTAVSHLQEAEETRRLQLPGL